MPPTSFKLGAVLRRVAEPVSEWQSQLELEHRRHWARKTGEHVVGAAAPRSGVAAGSAILQAALVSQDSGEGWRRGRGREGGREGGRGSEWRRERGRVGGRDGWREREREGGRE
jgi:hypothetical protein